MLINAIDPEESRIAVVEDGVLQELHVELANREAYLGNIYKGKVVNIEPSIGAAFVAFGGRVNGFLHVSDVLPAYGRPDFMLEDVIEGRARVDVDDGPESVQQALDDDEDGDEAEAGAGEDRRTTGGESEDGADGESSSDAIGLADAEGEVETVDMLDGQDPAGVDADEDDTDTATDAWAGDGDEDDDGEIRLEAVDDVEVGDVEGGDASEEPDGDRDVAGDDEDDDQGSDDDAFGFGDGLEERPLLMAAGGGEDDPVIETPTENESSQVDARSTR